MPHMARAVTSSTRHGRVARVDVVGKSSFYFDDSHDRRSDPYALVHVRVGLERDGWARLSDARGVDAAA